MFRPNENRAILIKRSFYIKKLLGKILKIQVKRVCTHLWEVIQYVSLDFVREDEIC